MNDDVKDFRAVAALVALHALLSAPVTPDDPALIARDAVTMADALLKELAK